MVIPAKPIKLRTYGRNIALVRQQIENTSGGFTVHDIFERLKSEPGIVLSSVGRALIRLRKAGEIIVLEKRRGSRAMLFERFKSKHREKLNGVREKGGKAGKGMPEPESVSKRTKPTKRAGAKKIISRVPTIAKR